MDSPAKTHEKHLAIKNEKTSMYQSQMKACQGILCKMHRMHSMTQFAEGSDLCFRCAKRVK